MFANAEIARYVTCKKPRYTKDPYCLDYLEFKNALKVKRTAKILCLGAKGFRDVNYLVAHRRLTHQFHLLEHRKEGTADNYPGLALYDCNPFDWQGMSSNDPQQHQQIIDHVLHNATPLCITCALGGSVSTKWLPNLVSKAYAQGNQVFVFSSFPSAQEEERRAQALHTLEAIKPYCHGIQILDNDRHIEAFPQENNAVAYLRQRQLMAHTIGCILQLSVEGLLAPFISQVGHSDLSVRYGRGSGKNKLMRAFKAALAFPAKEAYQPSQPDTVVVIVHTKEMPSLESRDEFESAVEKHYKEAFFGLHWVLESDIKDVAYVTCLGGCKDWAGADAGGVIPT